MALDDNFLDIATVDGSHELAKNDFGFATVLFVENAKDYQENQRQN
jgi:hypothetical protein